MPEMASHMGLVRCCFKTCNTWVILGSFRGGRADGEGMCFSSNGSLWQGRWVMNLRVGEFVCLDSQGKIWLEEYDNKGKRLARELHGAADCNGAALQAARCGQCGWLHHPCLTCIGKHILFF